MKKIVFIISLFVCSLALGQDFPQQPKPPRLVNDFAGILKQNENSALEHKLVAYNDSTSTQIAIVTIPSLRGYEIADYTIRLAQQWGVGQKGKDNGILILVALQDRKMFIATGYGAEAIIPDAIAKRIVENYMKPNFRNGNYYKGLDESTSVIIGLASGEFKADQIANPKINYSRFVLPLFIMLFYFFNTFSRYKRAKGSHMAGGELSFLTFMLLSSSMNSRGSGYDNFSSGTGSFGGGGGGFGGGGFGGGGAGGGW